MSNTSRHIGFIVLSILLSLSTTAFGAKRQGGLAVSESLALAHHHADFIGQHANFTNRHVFQQVARVPSLADAELASVGQAEIDRSLFVKADLAYVSKIALLIIIAGLALKTFREFRQNKFEEE